MVQTTPATEVTLGMLKQSLGLRLASDSNFFHEWMTPNVGLTDLEITHLDRVRSNFLELMDNPPMLENSVKMVVLSPLLDLAGFYQKPFRVETETSMDLEMEDEGLHIRGRLDVLVLINRLWLLVIESKRSDFSVTRAIPQALSYMLGNPAQQSPTFGMITNGSDFLFLKSQITPEPTYANSRLFSLVNPENDLCTVLQVLKTLGTQMLSLQD